MRKRTKKIIPAIAALLIGLGMLLYPYVSNTINQYRQSSIAVAQEEAVVQSDDSLLEAERARASEYNQALLEGKALVTDPFDPDRKQMGTEDYENILNLNGDGVMAVIIVPSIGLKLPIYHGTSEEVLQKGVGHLERTSLPVGEPSAHVVLSGHTGLPSMEVFDKLDRLNVGDYFIVRVLGEDCAYTITGVETVLPEETGSLAIVPGKDLITLITCTPYGVNTHRLLVHAERTDIPQEWYEQEQTVQFEWPAHAQDSLVPFTLIGIAIAVGALVGVLSMRCGRGLKRKSPVPATFASPVDDVVHPYANNWRRQQPWMAGPSGESFSSSNRQAPISASAPAPAPAPVSPSAPAPTPAPASPSTSSSAPTDWLEYSLASIEHMEEDGFSDWRASQSSYGDVFPFSSSFDDEEGDARCE